MTTSTKDLNFSAFINSLPPQNIDAEEAVLGAILLDEPALGRIINSLNPEAFYITAHKQIYKAALALHAEGKKADLMSVTTWLYDHKLLDKVGGQSKLAQLVERTVSAVNVDRYAELVMDKYLRRQVIQTGNEVVRMGYETHQPLEDLKDQIQSKIETLNLSALPSEERENRLYYRMMQEIEVVEMTEENPGLKHLKLKGIAHKYSTDVRFNVKELQELWVKHLIHRDGAGEMMSIAEIMAKGARDYTQWLINGLLRLVGLTVVHAPGGVGKTTLLLNWIRALVEGKPWEGFPVTAPRRRVLIIQTDENMSDTLPSLLAQKLDETVDEVRIVDKWSIYNVPALRRWLSEFDPDLVVVDSLFSVSANSIVSENDVEYARPLLVLNKVAEEHQKQIVFIHHSSKTGDARGTSAITAAASAVLSLSIDNTNPPPESEGLGDNLRRILRIEKFRGRCEAAYSLEFDGRNFICHGEHQRKESEGTIKDRIVGFLSQHRNTRYESEELAEFIGCATGSARRCTKELARAGIIASVFVGRTAKYFLEWFDDAIASDHAIAQDQIAIAQPDQKPKVSPAMEYSSPTELSDHAIAKNQVIIDDENSKIDDQMITSPVSGAETQAVSEVPEAIASSDHQAIANDHAIATVPDVDETDPEQNQAELLSVLPLIDSKKDLQALVSGYGFQTVSEAFSKLPPGEQQRIQNLEKSSIKITELKVGDRVRSIEGGSPATVTDIRQDCICVAYDFSPTESRMVEEGWFEALPEAEDPKLLAFSLFDQISEGDKLKICKHPHHGSFTNRVGTVLNKSYIGGFPVAELRLDGDNQLLTCYLEAAKLHSSCLKPGMRIRFQKWYGELSTKISATGRWLVRWESHKKSLGLPPNKPLLPSEFEVIV